MITTGPDLRRTRRPRFVSRVNTGGKTPRRWARRGSATSPPHRAPTRLARVLSGGSGHPPRSAPRARESVRARAAGVHAPVLPPPSSAVALPPPRPRPPPPARPPSPGVDGAVGRPTPRPHVGHDAERLPAAVAGTEVVDGRRRARHGLVALPHLPRQGPLHSVAGARGRRAGGGARGAPARRRGDRGAPAGRAPGVGPGEGRLSVCFRRSGAWDAPVRSAWGPRGLPRRSSRSVGPGGSSHCDRRRAEQGKRAKKTRAEARLYKCTWVTT